MYKYTRTSVNHEIVPEVTLKPDHSSTEIVRRIANTEILDAGELSHGESLRGRALRIQTGQITDRELIEFFLEERGGRATTRDNYETQLRRLQCFCVHVLDVKDPRSDPARPESNLRAVQRENWRTLVDYLRKPPIEHLFSKGELRANPLPMGLAPVWDKDITWRPFKGPLQQSSVATALTVIVNFYKWLSNDGIGAMQRSPFGGLKIERPKIGQTDEAKKESHYLQQEHWQYVLAAIDAMPSGTKNERREKARADWTIHLLVETGLRASEIAAARSSMIQPSKNGGWHLDIIRKGGVHSATLMPQTVIRRWADYRATCEISGGELGARSDDLPLVSQIRDCPRMDKALSRVSVWTIITKLCKEAARIAKVADDEHGSVSLSQCSPHWLRHTFGTWLVDKGADIRTVKNLMEHKSLATTGRYVHVDGKREREDIDRMTASIPRSH